MSTLGLAGHSPSMVLVARLKMLGFEDFSRRSARPSKWGYRAGDCSRRSDSVIASGTGGLRGPLSVFSGHRIVVTTPWTPLTKPQRGDRSFNGHLTTGCRRRRAGWEVLGRRVGRSPTAPEPER